MGRIEKATATSITAETWQALRHLVGFAMMGTFGYNKVKAWERGGKIRDTAPLVCLVALGADYIPGKWDVEFLDALDRAPVILLVGGQSAWLATSFPGSAALVKNLESDYDRTPAVLDDFRQRGLLAA